MGGGTESKSPLKSLLEDKRYLDRDIIQVGNISFHNLGREFDYKKKQEENMENKIPQYQIWIKFNLIT